MTRDERLRKSWWWRSIFFLTIAIVLLIGSFFIPTETLKGTIFLCSLTNIEILLFLAAGFCFTIYEVYSD